MSSRPARRSLNSHQAALAGMSLVIEKLWPEGWGLGRWLLAVFGIALLVAGLALLIAQQGVDWGSIQLLIVIGAVGLGACLCLPAIGWLVVFYAPSHSTGAPTFCGSGSSDPALLVIGWPAAGLERPPRQPGTA
ncbi:MAG: hypothetical protein NVV60_05800 [Luteimonas sp.]|nr:hypothetical protein [Luteimonas sp.]